MAGIHSRSDKQGSILSRRWQDLQLKLSSIPYLRLKVGLNSPYMLLIAPLSLRKGTADKAREIYAGTFDFSGIKSNADGNSPFTTPAPSPTWAKELHSFKWLRHLNQTATPLNRSNAQILVGDWIARYARRRRHVAWQVEVLAERMISWLTYAPLIVEDADPGFYQSFLRSIDEQLHILNICVHSAPEGLPRLKAKMAIAYASLCLGKQGFGGSKTLQSRVAKALGAELQQQFFADGGHISRNPDAGLDILSYLLPLYQLYSHLAVEPPGELLTTLDRALPMLEFFRHRDGATGLFNGATNLDRQLLETVLRVGSRPGQAPDNAVHSGYQRLEAEATTVLADTGKAHSPAQSRTMHAGCLSFEMSSGANRYIVNCGSPNTDDLHYRQIARSTAAHSTAIINDTSSCRVLNHPSPADPNNCPEISGIKRVTINRINNETGESICASHDGYLEQFGVIHQRSIFLSRDGNTINGTDQFLQDDGNLENHTAIRFHLHPAVEPQLQDDGISVLLQIANGDTWRFTCIDAKPGLEDSIFFTDPLQKTTQIVLASTLTETTDIRWVLEKHQNRDSAKQSVTADSTRQTPKDLLDILTREKD